MEATLRGMVDEGLVRLPELASLIEEINHSGGKDATIAYIGHFSGLGNSLVIDGERHGLFYVLQHVLSDVFAMMREGSDEEAVSEEVFADALTPDEEELDKELTEEEIEEGMRVYDEAVAELCALTKLDEDTAVSAVLYADGSLNGWEDDERVQQLIGIITEHAAYPFLYLVAGRTIAKVIQYFNEESKKIVEARGSLFVDIFDIPNENNMDPHPQATGHRFIADRLGDAMLPKVNVAITSGSGSVSSPARVLLGHDVTFEVEGVDGSELVSVTVNGNELDVAPDAATFTVSDVQEDLDVQVAFTGQKEEPDTPDTPERPSVWENLMNKLPVLQVISNVIRKAFSLRDILERTAAGTRVKPAFFNQFLNH